jgi:single-stranded-DNA-specific exonuclease
MAAGLTIRADAIEVLREKLNRIATEKMTTEQLQPVLTAEAEIPFSSVTLDLVKEIAKLAPFGAGNPTPVLVARDLNVLSSRAVGENAKHLKVKLGEGSLSRDGIGFNLGSVLEAVANSKKVDVAFSVEENTWNMVTDVQMVIKDIETGAQYKEETA